MGSEARTRLALAALLVLTLFGFYQVFGEGAYPGPALLGMVFAAAVAVAARRVGLGTLVTVGASALALLVYLCFLFATNHTLYGLPTPGAVRALARAVAAAVEKSSTDYAPVPARAGYVVMVVAGMWAATTVGEMAAFRWKRPLLAVLPSVALFSAAMVLGTGRGSGALVTLYLVALLSFWALESSHRLRSWGRWVPTFPGISSPDEEQGSVAGSIARRMGAATVAAALVAPIFLPALGDGLLAWRTGVAGPGAGGPGPPGSGRIDPFVSLAPRLLQQADVELFTVEATRPTYWRLVTLGRFDGDTWTPVEPADDAVFRGGVLGPAELHSSDFTALTASFTLTKLEGEYLPAAGTPTSIAIADDLLDDVRRADETGDLRLDGGVDEGLTYALRANLPDITYTDLVNATPGTAPLEYLASPGLSEPVRDFLDATVAGIPADEPYRRLIALQDRLRNTQEFTYSTAPASVGPKGASVDYLTTFLTETKEGYCQQYATAFALLARELGIPARVVVGFLPGESVPAGPGEYVVRGTDAHAWPEVYFERWGWIPFEPTPRNNDNRIALAPSYTQPANRNTGTELGAATEDGDIPPNIEARASEFRDALSAAAREGLRSRVAESGTGAEGAREDARWKQTFARLAVVLLCAFGLFVVFVPAVKEWRIRRRYARARDSREVTAAAYDEFLGIAAELAAPKRASESASTYARRIAGSQNLPVDGLMRLAALYEAAEFGRAEPGAGAAREARALARDIRARLWHKSSWWRRLGRLVSLQGLTAGRPAVDAG